MMNHMRVFLQTMGCVALLFTGFSVDANQGVHSMPAPPQLGKDKYDFLPKKEDRNLMEALENLSWVRVTPHSKRVAYVLATPWCGYCHTLYNKLDTVEDIEVRWILVGPKSSFDKNMVQLAAIKRSKNVLDNVYKERRPMDEPNQDKDKAEIALDLQTIAGNALAQEYKKRGWRFGYPSVIIASTNGKIYARSYSSFEALVQFIEPVTTAQDFKPLVSRIIDAKVTPEKFRTKTLYAKKDTLILSAPGEQAIVLDILKEDTGHNSSSKLTINGEEWYAINMFKDGQVGPAYVKGTDVKF